MAKELQRNFSVGSEWLYYKIYTGHKTSDLVLTEIIKPIAVKLMQEAIIDKWFFIRYADPKHHLRVRFHANNTKHIAQIISTLHLPLNKFMEKDLIWKIQLDTYQREMERYGHNSMELSETIFYHDSLATLQFLDLIEGDEGEELRWLFGLRSIDNILNIFGYSLKEKLNLMNLLKTGFGKEFGMARPLKKQLDDKYRKEYEKIDGFMTFTALSEPDYEPILQILGANKESLTITAQQILKLNKKKVLELELNELMGSYIHMLMNRLFKSKNRLNEMVCYDFIYRYYRSKRARIKK